MSDKRFSEVIGGGDGVRVCIVSRPRSSLLQLEVRLRKQIEGKPTWQVTRESLGHSDLGQARTYGHQLLGSLLAQRPELAASPKQGRPTNAVRAPERVGGPITLGRVVELYEKSAAFLACEPETRRDRSTAFAILLDFVDPSTQRRWGDMPANELDPEKVQSLVSAWLTGTFVHPRMARTKAKPGRVRNTLAYLRTACNWASTTRVGAARLLPERVFDGVTLPVELNPVQPRMDDDVLDKLLALPADPSTFIRRRSPDAHLQFHLLLLCAEAWGNRIYAILTLRPADLRFDDEQVYWDPANDKMSKGRTSHLPADLAAALRAELERAGRPETPWVFFMPTDPARSLPYATSMNWLDAGFARLGLTRPEGLGYHSLRRKWRSDRDDQPLKAVMEEGGWSSYEAAMRYAKPNTEERKAVALSGRRARASVTTAVVTLSDVVTPEAGKVGNKVSNTGKRRLGVSAKAKARQ